MIAFVRWLLKQHDRDDPIGDLARDMHDDRPNLLRYFRADKLPNPPLKNLRGYLRAGQACSEAIEALIAAYREWQTAGNTYRETRTDRVRTGYLALRFAILKRDGYRCRLCGRTAKDGVILEMDHIVARARGGSDDPDNLWTLCFPCNRGKRDKAL